MAKNQNLGKKSKFWPKVQILLKNDKKASILHGILGLQTCYHMNSIKPVKTNFQNISWKGMKPSEYDNMRSRKYI